MRTDINKYRFFGGIVSKEKYNSYIIFYTKTPERLQLSRQFVRFQAAVEWVIYKYLQNHLKNIFCSGVLYPFAKCFLKRITKSNFHYNILLS